MSSRNVTLCYNATYIHVIYLRDICKASTVTIDDDDCRCCRHLHFRRQRVEPATLPRRLDACAVCWRQLVERTQTKWSKSQWRRLHGARGARAPTFTNGWARDTVSRKTANKKLTKMYWPSVHHKSAHQNDFAFRGKSGEAPPKNVFPALRVGSVPSLLLWTRVPHFQIRSGATDKSQGSFNRNQWQDVWWYVLVGNPWPMPHLGPKCT